MLRAEGRVKGIDFEDGAGVSHCGFECVCEVSGSAARQEDLPLLTWKHKLWLYLRLHC